jgi:hypothetical protein
MTSKRSSPAWLGYFFMPRSSMISRAAMRCANAYAGRFKVRTRRLTADARFALYAAQRAFEGPKRYVLLLLCVAQNVAPRCRQHRCLPASTSWRVTLAGFEVIFHGRFWVITEVYGALKSGHRTPEAFRHVSHVQTQPHFSGGIAHHASPCADTEPASAEQFRSARAIAHRRRGTC